MSMSNLVERTALSGFTLSGMPVVAGQVVTLDPSQLAALADARCVERTVEANARVPVANLPALRPAPTSAATQWGSSQLGVDAAAAREELAGLERSLADARVRAADDIAGIERSTSERLEAIGREVREAEFARDERLRSLREEVAAAEASARARIEAVSAEAEAAEAKKEPTSPSKAQASAANKPAPAGKA